MFPSALTVYKVLLVLSIIKVVPEVPVIFTFHSSPVVFLAYTLLLLPK